MGSTYSNRRRQARGQQQIDFAALEPWVPAGRRLIAVDLENLAGGSGASEGEVRAVVAEVLSATHAGEADVVVWACGPTLLGTAMRVLPVAPVLGKGVDGADRKLLEYIEPQALKGRFASVVLGSGDGRAFTPTVARLAALGVPTDVLARPEATAASLLAVARSYTPLAFALAA